MPSNQILYVSPLSVKKEEDREWIIADQYFYLQIVDLIMQREILIHEWQENRHENLHPHKTTIQKL